MFSKAGACRSGCDAMRFSKAILNGSTFTKFSRESNALRSRRRCCRHVSVLVAQARAECTLRAESAATQPHLLVIESPAKKRLITRPH